MNIEIKTIPHSDQRYDTCGDWQNLSGDTLLVRVSKMKNWRYEILIAVHELIEAALCKDRSISEKSVTSFDIKFENKRKKGNFDEPGDDPKAPYYEEHQFASMIEEDLARQLKVDWSKYEKFINNL